MPSVPPAHLLELIENCLTRLLRNNPIATSSEAFVRETVELEVVLNERNPRYGLRTGINYHGSQVQQIRLGPDGSIIGWNRAGVWHSSGEGAKMRMANHSIVPRNPGEHAMSDAKFFGGDIPENDFIRCEFKVRGWLGKTRNLDGKQLLKDLELLANDNADLLVICLSEIAYRKWRGEGPRHQAEQRIGVDYFAHILADTAEAGTATFRFNEIEFGTPQRARDGWMPGPLQTWCVRRKKVIASRESVMPGAEHYIILCWRPQA